VLDHVTKLVGGHASIEPLNNANALVGQRERLLALGKLSAGLTHELDNPAAAASRAADTLRERLAGMRHTSWRCLPRAGWIGMP